MSAVGKILATLIALVIAAFVAGSIFAPGFTSTLLGQALGQQSSEPSADSLEREAAAIEGDPYPGDAAAETRLVDREAQRLVAVKTAASAGVSTALDTTAPFRLATAGRATLILPARTAPYSLPELADLAPETVSADGPRGALVVREHLAVMAGATLAVSPGERVLLAGDDTGFSSVVALGGSVRIEGTTDDRISIESWNPGTGAIDDVTADGRPYLRVVGGDLVIANADIDALGFWTGDTSGIAFDGERSPELEPTAPAAGEDGVTTVQLDKAPAAKAALRMSGLDVRGNAVGATLAKTDDAAISDSAFVRSLADGLVLARDVADAALTRVTASDNGRDGIVVGRHSASTTLDDATVEGNGRNGVLLDGAPSADGPHAATSVGQSAGSTVDGGVFRDNARTGIDVVGGSDVAITRVTVTGGAMGIVLDEAPRGVVIEHSVIEAAERHAVSIRDGADDVRVASNDISNIEIGVYVRNAAAAVRDNTVSEASIHGIALSGRVAGALVTDNELAGTGPTAIDSDRAIQARVEGNLVDGWAASRTLEQLLTTVMQPLTIVWLLIVTLVIVALITRLGGGRKRGDPLRDRRPLQSMSRGIMSPRRCRADLAPMKGSNAMNIETTARPRMTVVGTGYLGATHAICMAVLGSEVLGVDVDERKIAELASGRVPFFEPGLAEKLREALDSGRLRFTTDFGEAADFGEVHFICVGTPQQEGSEAAELGYVEGAVRELSSRIHRHALIVGKSTVPVGTAARLAELASELAPADAEVELAWNPEFLREGFAVEDTLHPDRLVFGVRSAWAQRMLEDAFEPMIADETPVIVADLATAELVKVAANSFLATKISYINAMAEVCEAAGADVGVLAAALSYDGRIGGRFLKPGLGFGGGCLPKDIRAFRHRAAELGVGQAVAFLEEVDAINMRRRTRTVDLVRELAGGELHGVRVAALGAAFKPDSDDVRDAPALDVARMLYLEGARVRVYDPEANANAHRVYPDLDYVGSLGEAAQDAEVVVLLTEWEEFRHADPDLLGYVVAERRVVDARHALDAEAYRRAGWEYRALGRPPAVPVAGARPAGVMS